MVPTVDALRREGVEYRGVLYAGLMLTHSGPKVLEFNCRFGDPETQALMARWKGDLLEALWRTAAGTLDEARIGFEPGASCCVVVCAQGYPGAPRTGDAIEGIGLAESGVSGADRVLCFHAGTRAGEGGGVVTAGGRVLGVTAVSGDLRAARDAATEAARRIAFPGAFLRGDIGMRVLAPTRS